MSSVQANHASTTTAPMASSRTLRQRSSSQIWSGAKRTINGLVTKCGESVSVRAPLCIRSSGRYDYPLPPNLCMGMEQKLRECGVLNLVQYMLKGRGVIRAQNIMLSAPGSINQPVHTDSQWGTRTVRNPKPHYLTILIALTNQDLQTGGTKVYPGTHRDARLAPQFEGGTVVGVEKPQTRGTAIVFDGLLQHHGTANVTNVGQIAMKMLNEKEDENEKKSEKNNTNNTEGSSNTESKDTQKEEQAEDEGKKETVVIQPRDRYFYYMSICIGQDANTEVTGYGGTNQKNGTKEQRLQAVKDAKAATNDLVVMNKEVENVMSEIVGKIVKEDADGDVIMMKL